MRIVRELNLPLPLTRQMAHWVRLAPDHYTVFQALRYGEIRGLGGSEALARVWCIQELLDSDALYAEERAMRHCVYTCANQCWRGETTIWSLRLRVNGVEKRMATIEVDPRKRAIIQARGKCNQRLGVRSLEIMRQWAVWAGLQLNLQG